MKVWLALVGVFTAVVIGAPNTKDKLDHENIQDKPDEVQHLVKCRTSQQYLNLSDLDFNPRDVPEEDTACLSLRMFRDMGFVHHFNIPEEVLSRFILRVQKGYREVPYHNWSHGFGVLHFSFAALKSCHLIEKHHFTPLEGLALLTAAMCHDLDHPGTNNQFQIEINSPLAQRYGQQGSVLERHHIAVTLGFLRNSDTNFLAQLDEEKHNQFVDLIRQIILATDLSTHFKVLSEEKQMAAEGFDKSSKRHRELLHSVIISCADLSDQTKDWTTVRAVAKLVYTEFFTQGDEERKLGLVPAKMMDHSQAKVPQQQVDFLSHVVIPVYNVLLLLYPETQVCMNNMKQNLKYWREAIPYFEEEETKGRNQLDILSDTNFEVTLSSREE